MGGKVYERESAGQWKRIQTPVKTELKGVTRGETNDVAVGAGGTIVERPVENTAKNLSDTSTSVERYVEGRVEMAWA